MISAIATYSSKESEINFLLGLVNDIHKDILNAQWPLHVKVMRYVFWVKSCKYRKETEYGLTKDGWLWYSLPDNTQ